MKGTRKFIRQGRQGLIPRISGRIREKLHTLDAIKLAVQSLEFNTENTDPIPMS